MKQSARLLSKLNAFELPLLLFLIFVAISRWVSAFHISSDSSAYITAALSFVHQGKMLTTNFLINELPSVVGPLSYNTYPLGFPLILASFLTIFHSVTVSCLLMQSINFVCLYVSLYLLGRSLGFSFWWRLPLYFFLFLSRAYQENFTYFLTEPLFLTLNIALLASALTWPRYKKSTVILLFLAPLVRFQGVFCFGYFLIPLLKNFKANRKYLISFILVSILPTALYFIRNKYVVGTISRFHGTFGDHVNLGSIPYLWKVPFHRLCADRIGVLVVLCVFGFYSLNQLFQMQRTSKIQGGILSVAAAISILSIWTMTLLSRSEPLCDRYLSVGYLFVVAFFIWLLKETVQSSQKISVRLILLGLLPLYFIFTFKSFYHPFKDWKIFTVRSHIEAKFWDEVSQVPLVQSVQFYATDYNFTHSLYSNRLQLIIERVPGEQIPFDEWEKVFHKWSDKLGSFLFVSPCLSAVDRQIREYLAQSNQWRIEWKRESSNQRDFCAFLVSPLNVAK